MSYSRRRDAATTHVTAGGPTLRRTAAPQTHATQHGRQRQRSRYRPTDSLQLPADQRPDTVDKRRRTRFRPTDSIQLCRLTHDPTRSTTLADSTNISTGTNYPMTGARAYPVGGTGDIMLSFFCVCVYVHTQRRKHSPANFKFHVKTWKLIFNS